MNRFGIKSKTKDITKLRNYIKDIESYTDKTNVLKKYLDENIPMIQSQGYFKDIIQDINESIKNKNYLDFGESTRDDIKKTMDNVKLNKKMISIDNKATRYVELMIKLNMRKIHKEKLLEDNPDLLKELSNTTHKKEETIKKKETEKKVLNKINNSQIIGLDAWLSNYKVELAKQFKMRFQKGIIKQSEYNDNIRNIDKYVENQKQILLSRAYETVGEIKGIEFGRIGTGGNFEGVVVGSKGKASIHTTLSGGLIQRLHYRIYVNKINNK